MSRYAESEKWLERAERTIPIGSQTFSKSRVVYPVGVSPLYISKAKGSHFWDLDNNKYIDLVNSLAAVTLGHCDSGMNKAIEKQLRMGVLFSLPGRLEAEVSEMLTKIVPSAEMVRFGKNGSDATSAAIRLARAYTGRDHIAICGYHGWQDWYIGATARNKGVPKSVSTLSHTFEYNNLESLQECFNKYDLAAVILEPMNREFPNQNFLEKIREITFKHGTVLIFDETITGFRMSISGAQGYFDVKPDLSTFGKGMANGMPISAVVGKTELMSEMEKIFFSGTFGGELLSLAAAKYTIEKMTENDLPALLAEKGKFLANEIQHLIKDLNLDQILNLSGHDSWKFLNWNNFANYSSDQIKTYFLQEMFAEGILVQGTHNISLSHSKKVLKEVAQSYEKVLEKIHGALIKEDLEERIKAEVPLPIFKVR